ncbi:MAG: UDP-N-acetylmuramate dehydrogenase, partial [Saprospiraceae bacterium]|nr:UDP-N-acetylmuramate dehydrogenase [Saprospiraceae bacterium]
SIHDVSEAVIAIRSSKLPDPKVTGNAGSFFKNPVISAEQFSVLKEKYPAIPGYAQPDGSVKVAAGWLIELCGLQGYRQGDAGVHSLQALVLVNHGTATGKEILQLSAFIQSQVYNTFQIPIEPEVNVW